MMALMTVLQRDLGVHYPTRFNAISDDEFFSRPEHLFAHGVLLFREGTCSSLPPTIASIGRALGYPLKIVKAFRHRFLRWDGDGERFNIECTSQGFVSHPDEYYLRWPEPLSAEQVRRYRCSVSLAPNEELALFIGDRARVYLRHGRLGDAAFAFARACQRDLADWAGPQSLVAAMNQWRAEIEATTMRGFPAMTITFPPRQFHAIPLDLERGLVHMGVKQDLLNDPALKARWWDALRSHPENPPSDAPRHIAVRFRPDPPHQMEYRLARELPEGFKPEQPA